MYNYNHVTTAYPDAIDDSGAFLIDGNVWIPELGVSYPTRVLSTSIAFTGENLPEFNRTALVLYVAEFVARTVPKCHWSALHDMDLQTKRMPASTNDTEFRYYIGDPSVEVSDTRVTVLMRLGIHNPVIICSCKHD